MMLRTDAFPYTQLVPTLSGASAGKTASAYALASEDFDIVPMPLARLVIIPPARVGPCEIAPL